MVVESVVDFGVPLSGSRLDQACTYQLHIQLCHELKVTVGRLGRFSFPSGHYVYTGSAKRNITARLHRHLAVEKKLRWHIDYLLAPESCKITSIELSQLDECIINQSLTGDILVPGFGASDCRAGCHSHLKYLGQL